MVGAVILKEKPSLLRMAEYLEQQKGSQVELYYFFPGIMSCVTRKLANDQNSSTKDVKFAFLNKEFISIAEYSLSYFFYL